MNELHQGKLTNANVPNAKVELNTIESEFKNLSPDKVIWDMEDLTKQAPWGTKISNQITDLSNYFITSDGRDFLMIFHKALDAAMEIEKDIIKKVEKKGYKVSMCKVDAKITKNEEETGITKIKLKVEKTGEVKQEENNILKEETNKIETNNDNFIENKIQDNNNDIKENVVVNEQNDEEQGKKENEDSNYEITKKFKELKNQLDEQQSQITPEFKEMYQKLFGTKRRKKTTRQFGCSRYSKRQCFNV